MRFNLGQLLTDLPEPQGWINTTMTYSAMRIVVLLLLQTLLLAPAYSAEPGSPQLSEEVSKQESIYRGNQEQVDAGYTVDRSLALYTDALSEGFDVALAKLGPNDRWLDIGAGKGLAILDYFTPDFSLSQSESQKRIGMKAKAIAISIEDRRTPIWKQYSANLGSSQIQYLFNKRLREYSPEELGQFQVITDVIGGFSYTDALSQFVEKALGFLKTNGNFYTNLQDVHFEGGTNRPYYKGSPFLTEIKKADSSEMKICTWLKSISCVEVTCESKPDWKPPLEAFHVRKVCNDVTVPALELIHYQAGTPPERSFKLKN